MNHGPFVYTSAPVGPADHLPVPSSVVLALGNWKIGPTAQIQLPACAGVRNSASYRSWSPNCSSGAGVYVTEIEGRATSLQSDVSENGTAG